MRKMNLWKIGAMMGIVLILGLSVEAFAEWSFQEAAKPYRGKTLRMIGEAYAPWEAYAEIGKDFEKLTGIKVDMESFDFAAVVSKFTADAVSKTGYLDAVQINTLYLARGAENGWILSNDFFADKPKITNPDFNPLEEFPEIYEAACYYEGKYYGVPYMFQAPAFAYRKDLAENPVERQAFFEKCGYELPAPPKTWAQLYDLVEFFTRKKGEKLAGKTLDESFYGIAIGLKRYIATPFFFTIYLAGIGGCNVLGPNGEIITETPVFRRAMEFYMSLRKFTPPGVLEYTWDETNTDMMMGRLFLVHGWQDSFPYWEDPKTSKVAGKLEYFLAPGTHAHWADTHTWVIPKYSKNPEAAWLWFQYLSQYEAQKKYQELGGAPTRWDVIKEIPFPWRNLLAVPEQVDLVPMIKLPEGPQIYEIIEEGMSRIGAGEFTIPEGLSWIAEKERELLGKR